MKKLLICCAALLSGTVLCARSPIEGDDTSKTVWPTEFREVEISSSADGRIQKAYFYKTRSRKPQPLIVSLHTWSGDYAQKDPLTAEILARDWNYIHPDFRGPNRRPEACGSPLVVSDIQDAIRYALENSHADPRDVHIIGTSGGGYATLLCYMSLDYPVKSFTAGAPISDLEAWYWESLGRKQKYAADIAASVSSHGTFDAAEARRRSPLYRPFPGGKRQGAKLFINEGIHDGYTGSVPVTHSIRMYNRLVRDMEPESGKEVTPEEIIDLVTKRCNPAADTMHKLGGRTVWLRRTCGDVTLTLFEGGHEQLPQAFSMLPIEGDTRDYPLRIFTIGDSNGNNPGGWVDQLKAALPQSDIYNLSQGGRTIGFDNNGPEGLNALRNVDSYIAEARKQPGGKYDFVIVCLGTNDAKADFASRQEEVTANFEKLLDRIVKARLTGKTEGSLVFVTPPPMGTENMLAKYAGGNERLGELVPKLKKIAEEKGFAVIDVYHPLQKVFRTYAADGVHMSPAGQRIVSRKIVERIEELLK